MIIVNSGSGTVTNINTALPLSGGPITTSGTITTSMATNKLIGRSTAGTGVMEEITVGTGLSLSGGTLSSFGAGAAGSTNQIQFNNAAAFAASANLRWIIADNRLLLGTENTADTNSRMVVIGKGISTQNTFAVHNSTGTNNSLIVRDDGFIGIGSASPTARLFIKAQGALISDIPFRIQNSSNTNDLIRVTGNGTTVFVEPSLNLTPLQILHNSTGGNSNNLVFQFAASRSIINAFGGYVQQGFQLNHNSTSRNIGVNIGATADNAHIFIDGGQNIRIGQGFSNLNQPDANATRTLLIANGVAPTTSPTDIIQMYSADIVAGNAAPHFRTENGNVIKIYQETTGVASATFVQNSGNRVDEVSTFDGYTIAQVVRALRNQGLLA